MFIILKKKKYLKIIGLSAPHLLLAKCQREFCAMKHQIYQGVVEPILIFGLPACAPLVSGKQEKVRSRAEKGAAIHLIKVTSRHRHAGKISCLCKCTWCAPPLLQKVCVSPLTLNPVRTSSRDACVVILFITFYIDDLFFLIYKKRNKFQIQLPESFKYRQQLEVNLCVAFTNTLKS